MDLKEFLEKYSKENPLHCYTELVTVEECSKCQKWIKHKGTKYEFRCPFKVLLELLKEVSEEKK